LNIEIVCKLNQLRSPFISGFFQNNYPRFTFSDSGIGVIRNEIQSLEGSLLAGLWGFPYLQKESRSINALQNTYYFPVDDEVEIYLENMGYVDKVITQKSTSYPAFVRKPIDPIGLNSRKIAIELALLISHSIFSLRAVLQTQIHNHLLLYRIDNFLTAEQEIEKLINTYSPKDFFIVNLCFRTKTVDGIIRKMRAPGNLFESATSSSLFSSKFEIIEPRKLYCSPELRIWLQSISSQKSTIIIIPPVLDSTGELSVDSILAGIWSTQLLSQSG
jgi:hypothetical protein